MKKIATILSPIILICAVVIFGFMCTKERERKIDAGVKTQETTQVTNIIESQDVSYVPVIIETMDDLSSRDYYPIYTITPTSTPTPTPTLTPVPTIPKATPNPEPTPESTPESTLEPTLEPTETIVIETTVIIPEETVPVETIINTSEETIPVEIEVPYWDQCDLSEEDFEFFARVVAAEDNGDHENDYDNQVAIAQVVWNRVDSPNWPNTVRGVLIESGQFSTVRKGNCHTTTNDNCRKAIIDAYVNRPHPANVIYFNSIGFSTEAYKKISDNYFSYE